MFTTYVLQQYKPYLHM